MNLSRFFGSSCIRILKMYTNRIVILFDVISHIRLSNYPLCKSTFQQSIPPINPIKLSDYQIINIRFPPSNRLTNDGEWNITMLY